MLIKFTYVDANTLRPMNEEPCVFGPILPNVPGIQVDFANESLWPCEYPTFYGHCDDDADTIIPGILGVLTQEEFDSIWEVEKADRVVKLTQRLRMQRNDMLSRCDWTQLPDAPLDDVKKQAWIDYRQALRDVTSQEGFPQNVEWPKSPDMPEELAVTV